MSTGPRRSRKAAETIGRTGAENAVDDLIDRRMLYEFRPEAEAEKRRLRSSVEAKPLRRGRAWANSAEYPELIKHDGVPRVLPRRERIHAGGTGLMTSRAAGGHAMDDLVQWLE
jgi:hypothetical protein